MKIGCGKKHFVAKDMNIRIQATTKKNVFIIYFCTQIIRIIILCNFSMHYSVCTVTVFKPYLRLCKEKKKDLEPIVFKVRT